METKHTPGPWKVDLSRKPYGIYAVGPEGIEEESAFKTPLGHVFRSHVRGHEGQQEANAQFIVKACNSHYELLKALKFAVKFLQLTPDLTDEQKPRGLEKWELLIKKASE